MEKLKLSPKTVMLGVLILTAADLILLLVGAMLIGSGVLSFDGTEIWSLISLLISALIAGALSFRFSGIRMNGYCAAALFFLLLFAYSAAVQGCFMEIGAAVKTVTALLCGSFLGNFFGALGHNRLRKTSKRKRMYTK